MQLREQLIGFLTNDQGTELAEYAVGVAILVAIGLVVYNNLGVGINERNTDTAAQVSGASSGFGL